MGRGVTEWLLKSGSCSQVAHKLFKLVAAVGIVTEHVETGEPRTEDDGVARLGGGISPAHRFLERAAHGMRDVVGSAKSGQRGPRLANEPGVLGSVGNALDEGKEIAPLGPAPGDEVNRCRKGGQRGLDGVEVCRRVRAAHRESYVYLILLTARTDSQDLVEGMEAGADDYLTKPFAFEELLARVRALLRKREAGSPTKLQVADLTMDLLTHKVLRAGREIELTSREFALLEYLIRNVETVVTRTMIAEHVWDVNFDTFTNVIDVYMSYLRNKIDRDFPDKLIRTVRGRGYVIKG